MNDRDPQFGGRQHSARSLALEVLFESRKGDLFVQELLERAFARTNLSPPDRRLVTHLSNGVLRRHGSLDTLIRPLVNRPAGQVEPWLWDALRLGAFQIAYLSNIPAHAAVHETVELAAQFQNERAKGFLNGVLRSFQSLMTSEFTDAPAADALPLEEGRYRRLSKPALPEPATDRLEYLAAGFSLPRWLAGRWLERYDWEECVRLGFWFAAPPPLWLRTNSLQIERSEFLQALDQAGIAAEAGTQPQSVRLTDHAAIRELPGYIDGWFSVQDESAMRVAAALAPTPGSLVLDLCAAPGGKTTHLAELMNNQGRIIACDVDDRRLQTIVELRRRLGITIVETRLLRPEKNEEPPPGPFDFVLVDAPCSNTGVLGRRAEVRWRLREEEFQYLTKLQKKLLRWACERVKPGGAVVYATCSIEPIENHEVVQAVLRSTPDLVLQEEIASIPGKPSDGGYCARLVRRNH